MLVAGAIPMPDNFFVEAMNERGDEKVTIQLSRTNSFRLEESLTQRQFFRTIYNFWGVNVRAVWPDGKRLTPLDDCSDRQMRRNNKILKENPFRITMTLTTGVRFSLLTPKIVLL
jgi:hypothetical protein